ncbi:MAG: bifunctional riboflavin kinase/FAD synthetase [Lentilitoribacter sp.]
MSAGRLKIIRVQGGQTLSDDLRGGVVAIGNFDGVHRGHQSVLERALEIAHENNVPALVMTFEPHPRAVFTPDNAPFRISPAPMKATLLEKLGFNAVVEQAFDKNFASNSAEDFISKILVGQFGVSHVVTGFDFHFGKGREGGPAFLMAAGEERGFGVTLVDAFRDENADVISSSRIRQLLIQGDLGEANALLGYRFTVEGEIIKGRQLGRELGYPTANMVLHQNNGLKSGIYAVKFRGGDGKLRDGVASFGVRPTVEDDGAPILETFVFDYKGDLYGQNCQVHLVSYLRGEQKFDGLDALVVQMKLDDAQAREVLMHSKPISALDQAVCFDV